MTDAVKSRELERLEKLYKATVEKMQLARCDWERQRVEFELELKNIAWAMDRARGGDLLARKAGA